MHRAGCCPPPTPPAAWFQGPRGWGDGGRGPPQPFPHHHFSGRPQPPPPPPRIEAPSPHTPTGPLRNATAPPRGGGGRGRVFLSSPLPPPQGLEASGRSCPPSNPTRLGGGVQHQVGLGSLGGGPPPPPLITWGSAVGPPSPPPPPVRIYGYCSGGRQPAGRGGPCPHRALKTTHLPGGGGGGARLRPAPLPFPPPPPPPVSK